MLRFIQLKVNELLQIEVIDLSIFSHVQQWWLLNRKLLSKTGKDDDGNVDQQSNT